MVEATIPAEVQLGSLKDEMTVKEWTNKIITNQQEGYQLARELQELNARKMANSFNDKITFMKFVPGQDVWIKAHATGESSKLAHQMHGPYTIMQVLVLEMASPSLVM